MNFLYIIYYNTDVSYTHAEYTAETVAALNQLAIEIQTQDTTNASDPNYMAVLPTLVVHNTVDNTDTPLSNYLTS